MAIFMFILSLICFVCLIIGIIKPGIVIKWGTLEKRTRKNVLKYYGIGLIVTFILFVVFIPKNPNTDNTKTTVKADSTVKEQPKEKTEEEKAADEAAKKAEEEKVAYDTGITYNQLARNPDDYKGKKAKFTGKVVQVMEGEKETDLRVAVDGNYDTILFVGYDPKITSTRVLENDNVTIKGKSLGIYSYQSTMGGKISIPGMWVDNITINNK